MALAKRLAPAAASTAAVLGVAHSYLNSKSLSLDVSWGTGDRRLAGDHLFFVHNSRHVNGNSC